jgi:hypothetical protein
MKFPEVNGFTFCGCKFTGMAEFKKPNRNLFCQNKEKSGGCMPHSFGWEMIFSKYWRISLPTPNLFIFGNPITSRHFPSLRKYFQAMNQRK